MVALREPASAIGIAHPGMPVFDRQVAGDDRGLGGAAVVDNFQQVGAALASSPAIPQSSSGSTSVLASCSSHFPKVPLPCRIRSSSRRRGTRLVGRRVATPAGVLRERTGQPGLARASRPGDQDAVSGFQSPSTSAVTACRSRPRPAQVSRSAIATLGYCSSRSTPVDRALHQQRPCVPRSSWPACRWRPSALADPAAMPCSRNALSCFRGGCSSSSLLLPDSGHW
ncbi:hypothetical protein ABIC07_009468 [Bradyrhizobium sp. RT9a]